MRGIFETFCLFFVFHEYNSGWMSLPVDFVFIIYYQDCHYGRASMVQALAKFHSYTSTMCYTDS